MPDHVLLAVHAHPDDESMGTGGTLARYAAAGVETVLVCATRGEEGEIQNPDVAPSKVQGDVARIRMKELEEACDILGIRRVFLLGYRDSGMAGWPSNAHPQALMNADPQEATGKLVHIIREVRPHVVITYNEHGLYGHPDHIAVNQITLSALEACGDPAKFPQIPWPSWSPRKLYYTAIPRSRLLKFKTLLEEKGVELGFDLESRSTPDEEITTQIDVSPFLDQKLRAIYSHRSQIGPKGFFGRLTEPFRSEALGAECYVCMRGCEPGGSVEDDLFSGI